MYVWKLVYAIYKNQSSSNRVGKNMFVMHIPSSFYKFIRNKNIKYPTGDRKNIWIGNLWNRKKNGDNMIICSGALVIRENQLREKLDRFYDYGKTNHLCNFYVYM